jgi:hypothetical protein
MGLLLKTSQPPPLSGAKSLSPFSLTAFQVFASEGVNDRSLDTFRQSVHKFPGGRSGNEFHKLKILNTRERDLEMGEESI